MRARERSIEEHSERHQFRKSHYFVLPLMPAAVSFIPSSMNTGGEEEYLGNFRLKPVETTKPLTPYLFQPHRSGRRDDVVERSPHSIPHASREEEAMSDMECDCRVGHTRWCDCGNCGSMTRSLQTASDVERALLFHICCPLASNVSHHIPSLRT